MSQSQPYAPALFADCLFNTNLLPASINSGTNLKQVSGSINGQNWLLTDSNPDVADFIYNINLSISLNCYGAGSGYQCVGAGSATSGVRPCRYIVMNTDTQSPNQGAQQLLVDANGDYQYINTTWTA